MTEPQAPWTALVETIGEEVSVNQQTWFRYLGKADDAPPGDYMDWGRFVMVENSIEDPGVGMLEPGPEEYRLLRKCWPYRRATPAVDDPNLK